MRNFPFIQHNDYIAMCKRLKLMGDRYHCSALKFLSNNILNQAFSLRIQIASRFIQYQDAPASALTIPEDRSGYGKKLPFTV